MSPAGWYIPFAQSKRRHQAGDDLPRQNTQPAGAAEPSAFRRLGNSRGEDSQSVCRANSLPERPVVEWQAARIGGPDSFIGKREDSIAAADSNDGRALSALVPVAH